MRFFGQSLTQVAIRLPIHVLVEGGLLVSVHVRLEPSFPLEGSNSSYMISSLKEAAMLTEQRKTFPIVSYLSIATNN